MTISLSSGNTLTNTMQIRMTEIKIGATYFMTWINVLFFIQNTLISVSAHWSPVRARYNSASLSGITVVHLMEMP